MTYIPSEKKEKFTNKFYRDKRRVFEYIVDRIFEQGRPAFSAFSRCEYIQSNGCRCAGGHILSDPMITIVETNPELNGDTFEGLVSSLREQMPLPSRFTENAFIEFMSDMQNCHDTPACTQVYTPGRPNPEYLAEFLSHAKAAAVKHKIETKCIDYYRVKLENKAYS